MAGYTPASETVAITAISAAAAYISLHTGDGGTTGALELTGGTYVRVLTTWGAVTSGLVNGSSVALNVPSGTTITHWGLWTTLTGGTFHFCGALFIPEVFAASGTYQITPTLSATN